jgi:hypothetical protein
MSDSVKRSVSTLDKQQDPQALLHLEGWLYKLESTLLFSSWKKFYLVLEGDKLCIYKSERDLEHVGVVELREIKNIKIRPSPTKPKDDKYQFEFTVDSKQWVMATDTEADTKHWVANLESWVNYFTEDWLDVHENSNSNTSNDASPDVEKLKQNGPSSQEGTEKKIVQITNSENDNKIALKDYYAKMKRLRSTPSGRDLASAANGTSSEANGTTAVHPDVTELNEKLAIYERMMAEQKEEIDLYKKKIDAKEAEWKQSTEQLVSKFESKKRSFNFILNSKDQQIEKLRQEKFQALANCKQLDEVKEELEAKKAEVNDLKEKLKQTEEELLDRREKEMQRKEKQDEENAQALIEATKNQKRLEDALQKVKEKYFFAIGMNIKLSTNSELNLNDLYATAVKEQIPFEQWQDWLMQRSNDDDTEAQL